LPVKKEKKKNENWPSSGYAMGERKKAVAAGGKKGKH